VAVTPHTLKEKRIKVVVANITMTIERPQYGDGYNLVFK